MIIECGKNDIQKIIDSITFLIKNNCNIFLLSGNVGAGKTYLVKAFAKSQGISEIASPTFSFIHEYSSLDSKIYHYDLYLKNTQDFKLKLLESITLQGIHFIEWGNKDLMQNLQNLGFYPALIEITESSNENYRIYNILS